MILNNGSEKESNLCWSFLMQSFSAIHPSTTTEINRKSVGQDQEWYLPENVTKEVFSKEIFGRAGIPIWLHVFQSSIFLHNHHPLNIQNVLCWFSHHFWPHLSQLKYFLLANTRDVSSGHLSYPQAPLKSHTRRCGFIELPPSSRVRDESEPDEAAEQLGFSLSNVQSRFSYITFRPPYPLLPSERCNSSVIIEICTCNRLIARLEMTFKS